MYKIPLVGKYHKMFIQCPECDFKMPDVEDIYKHCIGFSSDGQEVMVLECPICFGKWYFHTRNSLYEPFLKAVRAGKSLHFKP